jgi:Kef-type K+ transport system membrane component KefB
MTWAEIQEGPAFGFTVIGMIVVFGPLIAEKLRMPGLLGLLIGGALIGPNILDVLPDFTALESIGSIGVLYLIFLAGMQLDIEAFLRYRRISAGFGMLTAFIPLVLGTLVALALDIDLAASILIGSFWASFTLITYPTLSKYGLTRNRAVAATVGASSITDTISLIILALVIGAETGDSSGAELVLRIALGLVVLAIWCFAVVPAIARWFFTGLGEERSLRFMFVLISLTSSAVVAELVEIEPLIGAFFVGVGLNRIVPNKSPLMSVTDFFGNALFIPTFLVSVGLLFDPEVMFVWETIRLAIGFGAALIVGKAIAAWLSGRIFDLSGAEVGMMASVSVAQAAATLAATIIGLEAGLYGDDVVNAVMVVVAVSLILTSLGTNHFAPLIAPPVEEHPRVGEAVLLPADGDEDRLRDAFTLAMMLTESAGGVVQPLVVVTQTDDESIEKGRKQQARADRVLRHAGQDVDCELRVDRSVAVGLNRAALEGESSLLLLEWPGPTNVRGWLFGSNYGEIIAATALPVVVAAIHDLAQTAPGRVVVIAREADLLPGNRPSLQLGVDIASKLLRRREELVVGPLSADALEAAGIELPAVVEHRDGPDDAASFAAEQTEPGDVIVLPTRDPEIRSAAIQVYESGRNVLVAAHNPESQSALNGSTMTLPVGGSIFPT